MAALRPQRTLARATEIRGVGYWSGQDVRVELHPAGVDTGIVFHRADLAGAPAISALVARRVEQPRRTVLVEGEAQVEMVEHLLAALAGLRIDNCEIWVDAAELPGCDGSSEPFVKMLDAAGVVTQPALRPQLVVRERLRLGDGESWIEARPDPRGRFAIQYSLDYGRGNAIGRQSLRLEVTEASFRRELASARTFVLEHEARMLLEQGLGQRATPRDLLVFGPDGPIDNILRFPDECVRHKALDLVGDLALSGCDLVGQFVAHRSGHRLNAELVTALLWEAELVGGLRRTA